MEQESLAYDGDMVTTDPFDLFDRWMADAKAAEINDPNAMAVATVSPDGWPSVRTLLLKGVDPKDQPGRGFVFYTNLESRKGQDLAASPRCALLFHWKSLRRQIRVEGPVSQVSDAEADDYFASRPRGSRIGAWASRQSEPFDGGRPALEEKVRETEAAFGDRDVPRPSFWSGFRLTPRRIEFWQDREYRLHDRVVFQADGVGWSVKRLYP